jgi:hypothetical protein
VSNIAISDLHSTDFDLLSNSDSYMRELSDEELNALTGGLSSENSNVIAFYIGVAIGGAIAGALSWLFDALTD